MWHTMSLAIPKTRGKAAALGSAATVLLAMAGCGGGGTNPVGNPPTVSNPAVVAGKSLSFAYFQRCINPVLLSQLTIQTGANVSINSCAASGCHDNTTGTGGALRVIGAAQPLDLTDPANTPAVIRASDMYKNFYSAQGAVVVGSVAQSRLLSKPLLLGVLHGGGLIFASQDDPNAKLIQYWISHPAPLGQDEFSTASYSMFTPPDPKAGTCNTQ
jgi:hypothetical protein